MSWVIPFARVDREELLRLHDQRLVPPPREVDQEGSISRASGVVELAQRKDPGHRQDDGGYGR
jgi:hypothetical protein